MSAVTKIPTPSYDPLAAVEDLTDPGAMAIVAEQLNDPSLNTNRQQGAYRAVDLSEAIIDIIFDTVAQGASTLEVHVLDPSWVLFMRQGDAPAFFDVDDAGLLLPVDVNYPQTTDRWWRLCGGTLTVDPSQPHVLIFEDRIVSLLRDQGGAKHAGKNQTRAQFIYSCVRTIPQIRFVCPAIAQASGSVAGDLTESQVDTLGIQSGSSSIVAASAKNKDAPIARKNPAKRPGITRAGKSNAAILTSSGWRYTNPINGTSAKVLQILNPPTNVQDS